MPCCGSRGGVSKCYGRGTVRAPRYRAKARFQVDLPKYGTMIDIKPHVSFRPIAMLNDEVNNEVTQVLQTLGQNGKTSEDLLPLVYNELRQLAAARMAEQSSGKTLQATALA